MTKENFEKKIIKKHSTAKVKYNTSLKLPHKDGWANEWFKIVTSNIFVKKL